MVSARTMSAVVAMASSVAVGQTFVTYIVDGENLDTGQAGHALMASPGDTIRVAVRTLHDGLSYAGGKLDILLEGVVPADIGLLEEDGGRSDWNVGRTPIMRIVGDVPDGNGGNVSARPDPGLYGVDTVITDEQLRSDFTGWFDFASTPPGLGGLGGEFPVASGDRLFVFDYEYVGEVDVVSIASAGEARLWRDGNDINGAVVPADFGKGLIVMARCPADLDGDGDADSDDFFIYLDAFANGDMDICDIDGCGDCDADDFFAYLDLFAAGC